jgi:hypothetical protein
MTEDLICLCGRRRRRTAKKSGTDVCFPILSQQEAYVLCRVAGGGTSSDIARELSVSEGAIKAHIKSLLYKTRQRRDAPDNEFPRTRKLFQGNDGSVAQTNSPPSQAKKSPA